ncbi:MAG: nucleotide-binding protein [bacterium]|nr:nucleotide-binding protein [bacterium]
MKPFRIFIASSSRAQFLAQKLYDAIIDRVQLINSADYQKKTIVVAPVRWWKVPHHPGKATLTMLIDECKKCDFAAILLTQDDITLKIEKATEFLQPRDNCVFEAGLFTGALSLDPQRTFLLTSVEAEALPTDLSGIAHLKIEECGDNVDSTIERAANNIVYNMGALGPNRRGEIPLVAQHELMAIERLEAHEGGLIPASRIVVHTKQPLENLDVAFANRVIKNIVDDIKYRYFFQAEEGSRSIIVQLIWTLAVCGIDGQTIFEKRSKIEQDPQMVRDNLKSISGNFNIHFVNDEPKFEVCIHNSELNQKAVCYLRIPNSNPVQFVELCQGEAAKGIASSFLLLRLKGVTNGIFRSTVDFNFNKLTEKQAEYVRLLRLDITKRFPENIVADVLGFCFGK